MNLNRELLILIFCSIMLCLMAFLPHQQTRQPTPSATPTAIVTTTLAIPTLQIPKVIKSLYYGVSPQNNGAPNVLAMDNAHHRLYVSTEDGLTILNTQTDQFEQSVKLGLSIGDMQVDAMRHRLYISSHYGSEVMDIDTLTTTHIFSDITRVTFNQDKIYTANEREIAVLDADTFTPLISQPRPDSPNSILDKMYVNPQNHRLYLVVNNSLEIYTTDSLTLINTYPFNNISFLPASQQLMVYQGDNQIILLDPDGHKIKTITLALPKSDYYKVIAITDDYFYVVTAQWSSYGLQGYQLHKLKQQDFSWVKSVALPYQLKDIEIDSSAQFAYGKVDTNDSSNLWGYNNHLLKLNLATGQMQFIYTQLSIVDMVIDETSEQLYTLNQQGTVRVLDRMTQQELATIETTSTQPITKYVTSRFLSLDNQRQRLYVSGSQLQIVDTHALTMIQRLPIAGQVVANPLSNQIYVITGNCAVTLIDVDSWQQTGSLYPGGTTDPPPPMGPCIGSLMFDVQNQMLHATGGICAGGSSCGGSHTDIFDVSTSPPRLIGGAGGSTSAFDPAQNRFFVFGGNYDPWTALYTITPDKKISMMSQITGTKGWGSAIYDPFYQQFHVGHSIYDLDLVLLGNAGYSGTLQAIDTKYRLLYSIDKLGYLYVLTPTGGTLSMPSPQGSGYPFVQPVIEVNERTQFQIRNYRLYRSDDKGQTWRLLGYGLPDDTVDTLAVSPDYVHDQTLFAATGSFRNAIYRSTNGGESWQPVMRGQLGLSFYKIETIIFSPNYSQDQTLFVNMLGALLRSTDKGKSWKDLGVNVYESGHELTFSPNFATDKLIFQHTGNQFLRSVDRGLTWQPIKISSWPDVWGLHLHFSPTFTKDRVIHLIITDTCCRGRFSIVRFRATEDEPVWEFAQFSLPTEFVVVNGQFPNQVEFLPNGDIQLTNDKKNTTILPLDQLTWTTNVPN